LRKLLQQRPTEKAKAGEKRPPEGGFSRAAIIFLRFVMYWCSNREGPQRWECWRRFLLGPFCGAVFRLFEQESGGQLIKHGQTTEAQVGGRKSAYERSHVNEREEWRRKWVYYYLTSHRRGYTSVHIQKCCLVLKMDFRVGRGPRERARGGGSELAYDERVFGMTAVGKAWGLFRRV